MNSLAPLPFALPLLFAALLLAISKVTPPRLRELLAILCSAAVCGLCCALLLESNQRPIVYWFGGWVPRQDVAVGIAFTITPFGAGLAALASLLVTAALVFSWKYFDSVDGIYQVLMLVFEGAMCAFCLTGDLFNMFVWFELMSAAAYALTGYRIEEKGPLQGALNFAIVNTIGAYLVVCGLALLYGRTGALNFAQIGRALSSQPADGLVAVSFVLLSVGFLVKASAVPFHFWLADAHAVAPTPVCVLFSGVMVELGVYAVARLYWTMFAAAFQAHQAAVGTILLGAAAATAIVGAVFCLSQTHLKRLLAFSTISHVGLFLAGVALLTPLGLAGSAVYVLGHGLVKASLFMCTGILLNRFQTVNEAALHGRGREIISTGVLFLLGGLALAGLPPFGTFLGKGMIEDAAAGKGYTWLIAVVLFASTLTGAAVLRAAGRVFLGMGDPDEDEAARQAHEDHPETQRTGRTPAVMILPAALLMAAGLGVGLLPGLGDRVEREAARFLNQASYSQVVLDAAPALLPVPGLEPAGPNATQLISGLGTSAGAILLALAAAYRHRFPKALCHFGGTVLEPPLQRLRGLQSGDVRDYVAWLTFGVAGFGAAFAVLLR
jgi:multicomponent Na+:H+ antiporter subunit D